jgi:alpha-beta hydrolase superfamily lysophospholipase
LPASLDPPSDLPNASTLSTFTAKDGENLAVQDWPLPDESSGRGVVLLVHGLGEHAGRYDTLARLLNGWGFVVRGYDHHGHGQSGGPRGGLTHAHRLLDDLADIIDSTRHRHPGVPLVLLGHSLGGLVAAALVARGGSGVDGLVLSSPAFALRLNPLQKLMLAVLPRLAPDLSLRNGIDVRKLSHDPAVVAAYRSDPRVHDRISPRLARFMADEAALVRSRAGSWPVPTLLLYAGADRLVDPRGSRAFARAAPRTRVSARRFDALYHEIFNEADPQPVRAALKEWLDARF